MLQELPRQRGLQRADELLPRPHMAGWVDEVDGKSCVVCPYHGWAFDAEGYVRDVPASENKVG